MSRAVATRAVASRDEAPRVRDVDVLFRETDHLYYRFARDCGLSNAAYWTLVNVVACGGACSQAEVADEYSYSRQTVNSAVKSLEAKGYVLMSYARGSHRSKAITLTEKGEAFCRRNVLPAMDAERRAFESLAPGDRVELVRLVRAYADAIDRELSTINKTTDETTDETTDAKTDATKDAATDQASPTAGAETEEDGAR